MEKAYARGGPFGVAKVETVLKTSLRLLRRIAFLTHRGAATILVTLRDAARRATESKTHAHPSSGPGNRHCLPVGRDGAGRLLPRKTAGRARLFSGWTNRAVVGAGVFDRSHGDFDTHDYRDAGARVLRQHDVFAVGVRLPCGTIPDHPAFSAGIFSRRISDGLRGDRKTFWPADAVRGGRDVFDDAHACGRCASGGDCPGGERGAGGFRAAGGVRRDRPDGAVYL